MVTIKPQGLIQLIHVSVYKYTAMFGMQLDQPSLDRDAGCFKPYITQLALGHWDKLVFEVPCSS